MDRIAELGDERHRAGSTTDVTDQHADLAARLRSGRELRERLRALLERASSVEDVIAIVRTHEQRHPDDQATVILRYSVNDAEEQVWRWPVE